MNVTKNEKKMIELDAVVFFSLSMLFFKSHMRESLCVCNQCYRIDLNCINGIMCTRWVCNKKQRDSTNPVEGGLLLFMLQTMSSIVFFGILVISRVYVCMLIFLHFQHSLSISIRKRCCIQIDIRSLVGYFMKNNPKKDNLFYL